MKKIIFLVTLMACFLMAEAQTITKIEGKRHMRPATEYVDLDSNGIRYPSTGSWSQLQLDFRLEFTNGNINLVAGDTIIISGRVGNQPFLNIDTMILTTNLAAGATLLRIFSDEQTAYYTNVLTVLNDSTYEGTICGKVEYVSKYTTTIPPDKCTKLHLIKEQPSQPGIDAVMESVMEKVKIYPNPVSSDLHITNLKNTNVEIYNVVGQRVTHIENVSGDLSIDMKVFPEGIYFIKMQNGKTSRTEKVKLVK
jgi:hypothetical protein